MARAACRKDDNHELIATTLRSLGWRVIESWQFAQYHAGFPDLIAVHGKTVLFVEVKTAHGRLTPAERIFALEYADCWALLCTEDDALLLTEQVLQCRAAGGDRP